MSENLGSTVENQYLQIVESAIDESKTFSRWKDNSEMQTALDFVREQFLALMGPLMDSIGIRRGSSTKTLIDDNPVVKEAFEVCKAEFKAHWENGEWTESKLSIQSLSGAWKKAVAYLFLGLGRGMTRGDIIKLRETQAAKEPITPGIQRHTSGHGELMRHLIEDEGDKVD